MTKLAFAATINESSFDINSISATSIKKISLTPIPLNVKKENDTIKLVIGIIKISFSKGTKAILLKKKAYKIIENNCVRIDIVTIFIKNIDFSASPSRPGLAWHPGGRCLGSRAVLPGLGRPGPGPGRPGPARPPGESVWGAGLGVW